MASSFIGYVGNPDIHDGTVLDVEQSERMAKVHLRGASGRNWIAEFQNVHAIRSITPIGMLLYSLSEMSAVPPVRRFVFVNWYSKEIEDEREESKRMLEIDAENFKIYSAT
jgi:hypothetical protein